MALARPTNSDLPCFQLGHCFLNNLDDIVKDFSVSSEEDFEMHNNSTIGKTLANYLGDDSA